MRRFTRFGGPTLATLLTLSIIAGCEDRNIRQLTVGIPRDSVLRILGQGSSATDSTPNVYREERYLNDGHFITVLLYSNTGKKEGVDTIPDADLMPVVLVDDTLTGWGWEHHDSVATVNKIPIRPRDE